MNREQIIRMAREADEYANQKISEDAFSEWSEVRDKRFAALVAAAERKAIEEKLLSLGALEDGEFIMAIRARRQA